MQEAPEVKLSLSTRVLHWCLAGSVLFLFVSSWWMLSLPLPSDTFTYRELPFQLHKNIGITLIAICLLMIAQRLRRRLRRPKATATRWQKLAELDHVLTYLLLLACCLSGYLSSSFSGWTTTLWWLVDLPVWSQENDDLNILFSDIHLWTCWGLLLAMVLHIGAALYHAFAGDSLTMFPTDTESSHQAADRDISST